MEWKISDSPVPYEEALAFMEARAKAIRADAADECVWLLEHPPLYTAGTSAKAADLLDARFPVYQAGRGGEYTYHGPGQLVAYVMLDLRKRYAPKVPDIRDYVKRLENWIIATLTECGVRGELRDGRIGVWVEMPNRFVSVSEPLERDEGLKQSGGLFSDRMVAGGDSSLAPFQAKREAKIAALGVRISQGVTTHGIAINVNPDLSHYTGIVPCGIRGHGVTSLHALKVEKTMSEIWHILRKKFEGIFG